MDQVSPPDPVHAHFTAWAQKQGVEIRGVSPAKIQGRGLGIVAQRKIEAGEEIVQVPFSALLTVRSVPEHYAALHEGISVHGLLASFLAFGGDEKARCAIWKSTWPSLRELRESMPMLWPAYLRKFVDFAIQPGHEGYQHGVPSVPLPPAIGGQWSHDDMREYDTPELNKRSLLYRQEKRLEAAWTIVSKVFPERSFEEYVYFWLIVNTRSFYFEFAGVLAPEEHDDRMVLCPFIDYFNHSDHGCNVAFDESGFTVTSDRIYEPGEELYTSYGAHSNDFLLVEYGFILKNNKWDSLPLDDFFRGSQVDENKKHRLRNAGYLGNYTLSSEGVCHRTQVAVRIQTLKVAFWNQFVAGRDVSDDRDELKADTFIVTRILQVYYETAEKALGDLNNSGDGLPSALRETLIRRWEQIKELVREAFRSGINTQTKELTGRIFGVPPPRLGG